MDTNGEVVDDPMQIKEHWAHEYGDAFRASDGEEPVGVSAYLTQFTQEDVQDIPPFTPEMVCEVSLASPSVLKSRSYILASV